ncbi:MAG: hypothetical protein AAEJ04_01835, partial [Planctomycetota bacterium]
PQEQVNVSIQDPATGQAPTWGVTTTDAQGNYAIELTPGIWDVFFATVPGSIFPDHLEEDLDLSASLVFDIDLVQYTESIIDLTCILNGNSIELTWTNGAPNYDSISIVREGILLATIAGNLSEYIDSTPLGGIIASYEVQATRTAIDSQVTQCSVQGPETFIRCDAGPDGFVSIADAVVILEYLFASTAIPCLDSADCNDSGSINIADAVSLLQFLFGSGSTPPAPYPDPGTDPTSDNLDCF